MPVTDRLVVLFDLFETLVPGGTREQRDAVSLNVADVVGAEGQGFAQLVADTLEDRMRGRLGDVRETLRELAFRSGARPSSDQLERAVDLRLNLNRSLINACWGLPVLTALRANDVAIGVVSDCSAETPEVWDGTPLATLVDATAFSCDLGVRKPDPAIYLCAISALRARPEHCVFVGDGAGDELSGAHSLGIRTIWFDSPHRKSGLSGTAPVTWSGERITSLTELPGLLLN